MPALPGMLLIPAGLLAMLRKAFSQSQRISGAVGILYLRPLVGSLSGIVAAVLLYSYNHANAQAPLGVGIMYLANSDDVGDPWIPRTHATRF